ncbi:MAG: glutaminase A [Clostridia bacterium]|nr:glutaminase A [Clostridia bacterium]
MDKLLKNIIRECYPYIQNGKVATYIPELAKANPNEFGICTISIDQGTNGVGDYEKSFTMQSIVKAIILLRALEDKGEAEVRNLVGVEATGKPFDAFNYSDQDLKSEHINPMINAGAIALCTLIDGETYREKFQRLLDLTRKLAGNSNINLDEDVYMSEKATGNKNRALTYMLKAYGIINEDAEEVLDCYFRACSIKVTCVDLARIAFILANKGENPITGEQLFDKKHATYINAVLMTCGMYDGSGEFAITVGVPAKSGVCGGIMAVVPNRMGIGIYSPALDSKGNSCAGIKALEILSRELELSIF